MLQASRVHPDFPHLLLCNTHRPLSAIPVYLQVASEQAGCGKAGRHLHTAVSGLPAASEASASSPAAQCTGQVLRGCQGQRLVKSSEVALVCRKSYVLATTNTLNRKHAKTLSQGKNDAPERGGEASQPEGALRGVASRLPQGRPQKIVL